MYLLSAEGSREQSFANLKLARIRNGDRSVRELAKVDPHGKWLAWITQIHPIERHPCTGPAGTGCGHSRSVNDTDQTSRKGDSHILALQDGPPAPTCGCILEGRQPPLISLYDAILNRNQKLFFTRPVRESL